MYNYQYNNHSYISETGVMNISQLNIMYIFRVVRLYLKHDTQTQVERMGDINSQCKNQPINSMKAETKD